MKIITGMCDTNISKVKYGYKNKLNQIIKVPIILDDVPGAFVNPHCHFFENWNAKSR